MIFTAPCDVPLCMFLRLNRMNETSFLDNFLIANFVEQNKKQTATIENAFVYRENFREFLENNSFCDKSTY